MIDHLALNVEPANPLQLHIIVSPTSSRGMAPVRYSSAIDQLDARLLFGLPRQRCRRLRYTFSKDNGDSNAAAKNTKTMKDTEMETQNCDANLGGREWKSPSNT